METHQLFRSSWADVAKRRGARKQRSYQSGITEGACAKTNRHESVHSKVWSKRRNRLSIINRKMHKYSARTDGHRPIGRIWHASLLKSCDLAEAICLSTNNTQPLPHPGRIRSALSLAIQSLCLFLVTLKLSLIRAGQSCSSGSSRGNRCVTSLVGTRVSFETVRCVLRAARRR